MFVNSDKPKMEDGKQMEQRLTYSSLVNDPSAKPWYTQRRRVLLNAYIVML